MKTFLNVSLQNLLSRTDLGWKDLRKAKIHPATLRNRVEGPYLGIGLEVGKMGSKGAKPEVSVRVRTRVNNVVLDVGGSLEE